MFHYNRLTTPLAEFKPPEWLTLAPGLRTRLPAVVPGTLDRLIGMLTLVSEELPDCPFYFQTDKLCATLRAPVPKIADVRSAFLNAGYRVSFSHAALSSIKTDAPMSYIWDVMCAWKRRYEAAAAKASAGASSRPSRSPSPSPPEGATRSKATRRKKHPPSEAALRVVDALMSRPPNPSVDFTPHPDSNPPSRTDGLLRYQVNPLPNWGPKGRAKTVKNRTADDNSDDLPQPKSKKSRSIELH
ncbi:unnamed protein product [Mesocestoides corti]|uniref:tRNA (guanine(26)-N(2))-dimethyltransferase n=1 Tax=Mesocestoides corti TaxID=53468 RepID=A0A158QS16_MESCO|nr:unnamed protein product [Mesocestoides corti]